MKSLEGNGLLHVLDMMINERIYLSTYLHMNDVGEGDWDHGNSDPNEKRYLDASKSVRSIVKKQRFTCFLEAAENPLMWAHYAGGFSGVALKYELDLSIHDIRKIDYDGVPIVSIKQLEQITNYEIKPQDVGILRSKAPCWQYESEWRLYSSSEDQYITGIKPQALILGLSRDTTAFDILKEIAVKRDIKIGLLEKKFSDDTYYEIEYA